MTSRPPVPARSADGQLLLVMRAALVVLAAAAQLVAGAEIRLRRTCRPARPVVTLGDVAEIWAADAAEAERLAAIDLFPGPLPGQRRFLDVRQLQDLLLLRGVNLVDHRLSGSSQVAIEAAGATRQPSGPTPLPGAVVRRAEERVKTAIARYLEQTAGAQPWMVEVQLTAGQAELIAAGRDVQVQRGGTEPWTGSQQFRLAVRTDEAVAEIVVEAQVRLPPSVVVAAVSLPRDAIIRPGDLRFERIASLASREQAVLSPQQLIGKQTVRSIPAGTVIRADAVREPLLVRRNQVLTVRVAVGGVRVTTTARAREDGSLGDLIAVESPERRRYFARVTGAQEVEVPLGPERRTGEWPQRARRSVSFVR